VFRGAATWRFRPTDRTTCRKSGSAGDELKARAACRREVKVTEIEGNPGYYGATFHLRPHYQLEGVNVTLSLVSRLPSEKKG
jgi:type VI secretion system protein ImpC